MSRSPPRRLRAALEVQGEGPLTGRGREGRPPVMDSFACGTLDRRTVEALSRRARGSWGLEGRVSEGSAS